MKYMKLFEERRIEINDLSDDIGLFIGNMTLTLYNTKNSSVIAYMGLQKHDNTYFYPMVAAEKGYGPLIYELSMMYVGEDGLMIMRDGDIRDDAFNVWKRFYKSNRTDIKKETLSIDNPLFNFSLLTGEYKPTWDDSYSKQAEFDTHIYDGYEEDIYIYNTKMYIPIISDKYKHLIKNANNYLSSNTNISIDDIELEGIDYFSIRYG